MVSCIICKRDAQIGEVGRLPASSPPSSNLGEFQDRLCIYHSLAFENINNKFQAWRRAYGENVISLTGYLGRIKDLPETGLWVREVAQALLAIERKKQPSS